MLDRPCGWTPVVIGCVLIALGGRGTAQTVQVERVARLLDTTIQQEMLEGQIPSLTIALVEGDRVVWSSGYGQSNLWARTPATASTVYLIGSTFKTLQTAALLQLMDQGKLALDDPVSDYLADLTDLVIQGEDPTRPITFRHLLTHSSGILGQAESGAFPDAIDEMTRRVIPYWDRPFQAYPIWAYALPPPITDYLRASLRVTRPPLERVEYSPVAFTLIAHLTEKLSGLPFLEYIQRHIFDPLEMTSTAFIPTADMDERFAIPYVVDPETKHHVAISRVRVAIWPTGQVYGTALDLANWLIANLNDGRFEDRQVIAPRTLSEIHRRQFEQLARATPDGGATGYGLGWNVTTRGDERYISHSGSLPGETAFLMASLDRKIGVALLSNGNQAHARLERIARRAIALSSRTADEDPRQQ